MALDIVDQDDKDKNKAADSSNGNTPPPQAGVAPSQPNSSSSSAPSAGSGNAPTIASTGHTGTGFTNLQNIIGANKNNNLGNAIGSGVTNKANDFNQSLNQSQQQFQTDTNAAASQYDPSKTTDIINKITGYKAPVVNTTGSGPNSTPAAGSSASSSSTALPAGLTQADVDAFTNYRSGNYSGPQGLSNADALQNQATQVQQLGQQVSTPGGIQNLLQQFAAKGAYTTGQQNLDQLILGQTGGQQLAQAKKATLGVGDQLNDANTTANAMYQQQQGNVGQFAANTNTALQSARDSIANSISNTGGTGTYDQALAQQNTLAQNSQYIQDILSGKYDSTLPGGGVVGGISQKPGSEPSLPNPNQGQPLADPYARSQAVLDELLKQGLISNGDVNGKPGGTSSDYRNLEGLIQQAKEVGVDPSTALGNALSVNNAQNLTQSAFVDPTKQAQLQALMQLSGQTTDPLLQTVQPYQAGNTTYNIPSVVKNLQDLIASHNNHITPAAPKDKNTHWVDEVSPTPTGDAF